MKTWEYLVERFQLTKDDTATADFLSVNGVMGWELVQIIHPIAGVIEAGGQLSVTASLFVFKREVL
jgi:hypothetical protein